MVAPRGIPLISKSTKGVISMDIYWKKATPPTHPNSWYIIVRLYNELKTKNLLLTSKYEMVYSMIITTTL